MTTFLPKAVKLNNMESFIFILLTSAIFATGYGESSYRYEQLVSTKLYTNKSIDLGMNLPSKDLVCAMKCSDDTSCQASHVDEHSKCYIITNLYNGTASQNSRKLYVQFTRFTENKTYKAATKPEDKLHATCTQLQLISKVTQDHCVLFARSFNNANTISYDVTNSECSIQQCQQSITTAVKLASEAVIMFEAAFYPKSCMERVLATNNATVITGCTHLGSYQVSSVDACKQQLCSRSRGAANYINGTCNVKQCTTEQLLPRNFKPAHIILYEIPRY